MQINLHIKQDRVVSIPNQQTDYQKYKKIILFPTTKLSYNIVAESIVISMYYWNLAAILYLFIYGKKLIFFRLPIGRNIFLHMYIIRYKEIFKFNLCKSVYNMDSINFTIQIWGELQQNVAITKVSTRVFAKPFFMYPGSTSGKSRDTSLAQYTMSQDLDS